MIALLIAAALPSPPAVEPDTIVVTAPGGSLDTDDAIVVGAREIRRGGTSDVLGALTRNVPGLSLGDAQGNPFQPNLTYRGFVASPLQGGAQGLAVYLDGGRFNQPFGDTVDFDLLPDAAIDAIAIKDASPVYGLNALGGAIAVTTKTGRSAPGVTLAGGGGRFGRAEGEAQVGWSGDHASGFVAVQARHDDGWRAFSPSTLYNGFADLGWDGAAAGLHVKLVGADSDLTGNGTAPVELLAADRRAVFTHPDTTRNRYARLSLHPYASLSDTTRIEATGYAQILRQRTVNGDAAEIERCGNGLLCLEGDGVVFGSNGAPVRDTIDDDYGLLNRSATRTRAGGVLAQVVDTRPLLAGDNELVVGVSHDRSRTRFSAASELGDLTDDRGVEGLGVIVAQPDGAIAPVGLVARTRYTGLFVSDRLPLLPGLTAELGLRWNDARIALDDRIGTALDGRHRFRRLNPGVEIDYAVTRGLSLRAGYAETNRAPTPAELSCADEAAPCSLTNFFVGDPPLAQVVARAWEAGASGHIDRGWAIDWLASAYRTTNRNDIQFVASAIGGRAFFRNIGATRRQGGEASVTATRGGWRLRAGYALTDATFRTALLLDSPNNPAADAGGRIAVARGDRLPGVPHHRGTLSVDYDGPGFSVGGDVRAQSGQGLTGDEANLTPRVPGFAVVDLRGSVVVAGPVSLFATLTNAFDRRYATFGTFSATSEVALAEVPGATDPRSLGPAAPRRWFAGLRATF